MVLCGFIGLTSRSSAPEVHLMTRETREQYRLELPPGSPKPLLPRSSKSYLGAVFYRFLSFSKALREPRALF